MTAPKSRCGLRLWLARLALLAVSFCLVLGLLEVLIRIFMPYYHPGIQVPLRRNEEGVVIGIPNLHARYGTPKGDFLTDVRFNRHGFRDAKDHAQAGTNDIFIAGDSFSMGWGVEEEQRYGNLLEKRLGARFYNLAIPEDLHGYARTLKMVERHGTAVRHLVIGLCMENDLWDYKTVADRHAVYQTHTVVGFRQKLAAGFRKRSALWVCASHNVQSVPALRRLSQKIGIARNVEQLTHQNVATPAILESSRDELVGIATNYNAVVLVIPSRALWWGKNIEVEKKVHEQFTGMLRGAGLKLIDMKPIIEQTGEPLSCYFKSDPHWNVKGHSLAAESLAKYLTDTEPWRSLLSKPASPAQ